MKLPTRLLDKAVERVLLLDGQNVLSQGRDSLRCIYIRVYGYDETRRSYDKRMRWIIELMC